MNIGYCRFCGKGSMIDTDRELMQVDLDDMATYKCECDKAQRERYERELMDAAADTIENLMDDEYEDVREAAFYLTKLIATGKIMSAVLKTKLGNKVSIKMDSKMKIKYTVERKESKGAEV